jgi:hypothetical protein
VFNIYFQILTDNILEFALSCADIKSEKGLDSLKAAPKSISLAIHSPLVVHVALEVLQAGQLHQGYLLNNAVNNRS